MSVNNGISAAGRCQVAFRRNLTLGVLVVLLGSLGAAAGQRRTEIVRFNVGPFDEFVGSCGSFDVYNSYSGMVRLMVRRDKSGSDVQSVQHFYVVDSVYYNSGDPGVFVEGSAETTHARFIGDLVYLAGPGYRVTVPGAGLVFRWMGHWIYNISTGEFEVVGGKSDLLEGQFEDLCKALTPR
jgi:hypothetical protein